jgi:hypothetical protein
MGDLGGSETLLPDQPIHKYQGITVVCEEDGSRPLRRPRMPGAAWWPEARL